MANKRINEANVFKWITDQIANDTDPDFSEIEFSDVQPNGNVSTYITYDYSVTPDSTVGNSNYGFIFNLSINFSSFDERDKVTEIKNHFERVFNIFERRQRQHREVFTDETLLFWPMRYLTQYTNTGVSNAEPDYITTGLYELRVHKVS